MLPSAIEFALTVSKLKQSNSPSQIKQKGILLG